MPESRDPQDSRAPTLEQLLRAKRAERPRDEFWSGFEDRLRERMLREVVAPAPKVDRFPIRRRWLALGLSAAAAVAFSLVPLMRSTAPEGSGISVEGASPDLAALESPAPVSVEVALSTGVPSAPRPQFVSDQLESTGVAAGFQRVLASEMLSAGPLAAVYVAYPISRAGDAGSVASVGFDRF